MQERQFFLFRFFSFSGRMNASSFWRSFFKAVFASLVCMILALFVVAFTIPGDTEDMMNILTWVHGILGAIFLLRIVAISRRRLRDGGYTARGYLILLVPIYGLFLFIARRLCAYSKD